MAYACERNSYILGYYNGQIIFFFIVLILFKLDCLILHIYTHNTIEYYCCNFLLDYNCIGCAYYIRNSARLKLL